MKAILVVDMPNDMNVEETKALNVTLFNGLFVKELKIDCPLKPMPNEREEKERVDFYDMGWNDCVRVLNNDYNLCKLG